MSEQWSEGQDCDPATYSERVWHVWWLWILALMMSGSLGLAYGTALTSTIGLITFAVTMAMFGIALVRGALLIRVDQRVLRVGRARLPLQVVGRVAALDSAQSQAARTTKSDASGFFALRTLSTKTSVFVEVHDADDPHGSWLISTRRPVELAHAIAAGRDAQKPSDTTPSA